MKILDLDLDFFLYQRETYLAEVNRRLDNSSYKPWSHKKVMEFLETHCGLNTNNKPAGQFFTDHDEVFYYLRKLQENNDFALKFQIDHVDAHCDLGYGDLSRDYIASEILDKDLAKRAYSIKKNGLYGLSKGNFLAFAIACRWVSSLNYINRTEWKNDIPWYLFKNFDVDSNSIQLRQFSKLQIECFNNGSMLEILKSTTPITLEPEVPFIFTDFKNFKSDGKYDAIFLTHSPEYTPKKSDKLIPVIKKYMSLT
jgi:hypothetical protein